MARETARILVMDDDEVVLTAIADMLEEAGYEVHTLTSPIGATHVITTENIDLAIIDINLPVMQGDNVVRLLRSWDRLKDLPVVVISGISTEKLAEIQTELRNVCSVSKATMHTSLLSTVETLLRQRAAAPRGGARTAATRLGEITTKFLDLVATQLGGADTQFQQLLAGNGEPKVALLRVLSLLRGQAQLLGLQDPARMLAALYSLIEALKAGAPCPPSTRLAVQEAVKALAALRNTPNGTFANSPEPLITSLNRALASLSGA